MAEPMAGFEQLDRRLVALGSPTVIKRLAKNAVVAGQRVLVKGIKSQIPGKYREVKKMIGQSFKRVKIGEDAGSVVSKVGVAVGKRPKESDILGKTARRNAGKKGVGIGLRNVHWMFLGTRDRYTKRGKYTGSMNAPLFGAVKAGVSASASEAANKIKQNLANGIAREAQK